MGTCSSMAIEDPGHVMGRCTRGSKLRGVRSLRLLTPTHLLQLPQGWFAQSLSSSEAVILLSLKLDAWLHLSMCGVPFPCHWYTLDIPSRRAAQKLLHILIT